MKCSNCQHEQSTGKFCGKCGGALVADAGGPVLQKTEENVPAAAAVAAPPPYQAPPADPNQHVEKVKETSKQYWNYFLQYVKNPGSVVGGSSPNLINAVVTMAVFALILALALYKNLSMVLQPMEEFGGFFGASESYMPSFFSVLLSAVIFLGLVFMLSAVSILIVNKFAGPGESFRQIISSFGTLLIPTTVLLLAGYLLLLIESNVIGNLVVLISIGLSIGVLPLYLMTALLMKTSKSIDSYYGVLAYLVIFTISFSILATIFFDSTIGKYIQIIEDSFYF